jgi:hypothetical protein
MILDPKSRKAAELAETELMELVRGGDADLSLWIECRNGRWAVRCTTPGTAERAIEGTGDTFTEAWQAQEPAWSRFERDGKEEADDRHG